jgi:hypothetical protein
MSARNRTPFSSPQHLPASSLSPSAIRPSPLAKGTVKPLRFPSPVTSPRFLWTQACSSPDQDYLEDFAYSDDMADDFRRIDTAAAAIYGDESTQEDPADGVLPDEFDTPPPRNSTGAAWVVFHGRNPGIYDNWYDFPLKIYSRAHSVIPGWLRYSTANVSQAVTRGLSALVLLLKMRGSPS